MRGRAPSDVSHLRGGCVLVLDDLLPELLHLPNACLQATVRGNHILFSIQPQGVFCKRGIGARGGRTPEVILVKRDGERRVGGKDQLCVAFTPVSTRRRYKWQQRWGQRGWERRDS